MNRKDFIKTCSIACIGLTGLVGFQGCSSTNYFAKTIYDGEKLTVKKSEFLIADNAKKSERKFVLIKSESLRFPIIIYKLSDIEYTALLIQCTHNGCELQTQGSYLTCPCHGSEFTNKGVVLNPPAETNLKSYKTTTDHENIYVHL